MPAYSVAVASLAVQAPPKWTDNLLAQHSLPEVALHGRGVERALSWPALLRIALIRELTQTLGCSVRDAVRLSVPLLTSSPGAVRAGEHLALSFDRVALERTLRARLGDALESAPRPRRGRPSRRGEGAGRATR